MSRNFHRSGRMAQRTMSRLRRLAPSKLAHGIYRSRNDAVQAKRRIFIEGVFHDLLVHPLTLEIAQLAGRIEGEQAAKGNTLAFQDL